jgi:hypothetical protein
LEDGLPWLNMKVENSEVDIDVEIERKEDKDCMAIEV